MVSTTGNTVTMIRRTGVVPPIEGPGLCMVDVWSHLPVPKEGGDLGTPCPCIVPHVQFRQIHSVFIELDAASLLRQAWLETGAIIMLSALLITVPLFYRNSRRLARYRTRAKRISCTIGEAARTLAHEIKIRLSNQGSMRYP